MIDTADKRSSAINFGGLWTLPIPDGSIDGGNQQHLLDCYSGIAFAGSQVGPVIQVITSGGRNKVSGSRKNNRVSGSRGQLKIYGSRNNSI